MPKKKSVTPLDEQNLPVPDIERVYGVVKEILEAARSRAYQAVNTEMVQAYWEIGRVLIEEEQHGQQRAEYGKSLVKQLSQRLVGAFGKGFTKPVVTCISLSL